MKIWIWVLIIVGVSAVIIYSISEKNKRILAEKEAELTSQEKPQVLDQRTNVWDVVNGLIGKIGGKKS